MIFNGADWRTAPGQRAGREGRFRGACALGGCVRGPPIAASSTASLWRQASSVLAGNGPRSVDPAAPPIGWLVVFRAKPCLALSASSGPRAPR